MTYEVLVDGRATAWKPGQSFQWAVTAGVTAPLQFWELHHGFVNDLVESRLGQELTLTLHNAPIKRVIFLGNAPTGDPQTQFAVFSDVRWYFTRQWIVRDLNVRRRIGSTRLVGDGPVEAQAVVPDVRYAPWTINETQPWTWEAALRNVLAEATNLRGDRPTISWTRDSSSFLLDDRIVEETVFDDSLPVGLMRALQAVPGRDLYPDLNGVLHVFDRVPGAERFLVESLPPPLQSSGSIKWVNMAARRPKKYRVLYTPECEVRIDVSPSATFGLDDPFGENVLRVPEPSLTLVASTSPGGEPRAARTVGYGTPVTHAEAYVGWGAPTGTLSSTALSDDIVRSCYTGSLLELNYVISATGETDPIWAARVDEATNTYRVLFRINPRFWARVRSAQAKLSQVWDVATATRADSPVFCDYARRPSRRSLAAGKTTLGANVTSYNDLIASARKAPAKIRFEDVELGILRVEWIRDATGETIAIAPSALESVPDLDPAAESDLRALSWVTRKLVPSSQFKLSTIISCVPAAPNDLSRLYPVEVSLEEAAEASGIRGLAELKGIGPDQDLRARQTTARIGWSDDLGIKTAILAAFGVGKRVVAADGSVQGDASILRPVNLEDELRPLAKAIAAADLVNKLDHYEGALSVPMATHLVPIGTVGVVVHRVQADAAVTEIQASPPAVLLDPMAALPASARKILAREVQP